MLLLFALLQSLRPDHQQRRNELHIRKIYFWLCHFSIFAILPLQAVVACSGVGNAGVATPTTSRVNSIYKLTVSHVGECLASKPAARTPATAARRRCILGCNNGIIPGVPISIYYTGVDDLGYLHIADGLFGMALE